MFKNISIRAGKSALKIIRENGLNLADVKVLAGASGSAKFLVLTGIDRALTAMLSGRKNPLYLVGTSIGAFRMAALCQPDPLAAIDTLEQAYIDQQYELKPSKNDITQGTIDILDTYIKDRVLPQMLHHPFMRINFLSNKCRGLLKSDRPVFEWSMLGLAAAANLLSRKTLGLFFKRALFSAPDQKPPFCDMNLFPMETTTLTPANFKAALLSSGSIPIAMEGIRNIEGAPGVYRDGGILDYHLDIPFLPKNDAGLVLFPHFYETITPGWFDKGLNRRPDSENMKNVVLIAPSPQFVETLPGGRIPDRKDFYVFKGNDSARKVQWKKAADQCQILGEAFCEAVETGKISELVKPLY